MTRPGVLFVSYNGLLDPLGSSQVLPYVERLHGPWRMQILSFERGERLADSARLAALRHRLDSRGIGWTFRTYRKGGITAKARDLFEGSSLIRRICRDDGGIRVLHARGYVPAEMAFRARTGVPVLFDIRGLQPEEYVEGGLWKAGSFRHRLAKRSERRFFRDAKGAVVLSRAILDHVEARFREQQGATPPIEVIPCCVDLTQFTIDPHAREEGRGRLGVTDETTLFVYAGSLGTWYPAEEMARFVRTFRDTSGRRVRLRWLVNNDADLARAASQRAGLSDSEVSVDCCAPEFVPRELSCADAALTLVRPTFSKRASSPTKYAESLALGLPLVLSQDVGDGEEIERRGGAVSLPFPPTDRDLEHGARRLLELLAKPREHFRSIAQSLFDIEAIAIPAYARLYGALAGHSRDQDLHHVGG